MHNIPYFTQLKFIIQDKYEQTRIYISKEEFDLDKKSELEIKKYKRKYDIYNCVVEDAPILENFKEFNEDFYFKHYKVRIKQI